jgi:hypothetical protein
LYIAEKYFYGESNKNTNSFNWGYNCNSINFNVLSFMEIWKSIKGFENIYEVSNLGRVKSIGYGKSKILKGRIGSSGYLMVSLYKDKKIKGRSIHSLVAEMFLNHKPNGMSLVVNHKNNIKTDNVLDNLEIITQRENTYTHHKGTSKYKGVSYSQSKNKWCAQIMIENKKKHLGYFKTEVDAAFAYQKVLSISTGHKYRWSDLFDGRILDYKTTNEILDSVKKDILDAFSKEKTKHPNL